MSNNTITKEQIESIISKVDYQIMGEKTTICVLTLNNGFEVVGQSACVDPHNFDKGLGEKYAYENAFEKVWELEGYWLQSQLHQAKHLDDMFQLLCKASPVAIKKKSLHNTDINGAHKNVKDIVVFGNGDMFQLLCKASSENEGWMKSTKAMEIPEAGCVVQVTTQQRNLDGSYAVAEAVTFVPGVQIKETRNSDGTVVGRELKEIPPRMFASKFFVPESAPTPPKCD